MTDPREEWSRSRRAMLGGLAGIGALSSAALPSRAAAAPTRNEDGSVSIADFLTDAQRAAAQTDQPLDCTDAFTRALATRRTVMVSKGRYMLAGLRLPNGARLLGDCGAILHQARPDVPGIACISDKDSGQLADIVFSGFECIGHPHARTTLVLIEARGAFAIWRSRFAFVARKSFRALEVDGRDANNVFECEIEVVSEGTRDTAVLVRGGCYNRYHLFLVQTRSWALDDSSGGSVLRVVAENCVIFRGQTNQVMATVEGIAAPRAADQTAISDTGFGNVFYQPQVNMPASDKGKLRYAFRGFDRTVFISPQIIGDGVPPDPFAPTSNLPFTVIGGRSGAANRVEATFNGADPDHDLRNITFVGDVRDFTGLATRRGTTVVQRVVPDRGGRIALAATTQTLLIDAPATVASATIAFPQYLAPTDGWILSITTTHAIDVLKWPMGSRYARLPKRLAIGQRLEMVYHQAADTWFVL